MDDADARRRQTLEVLEMPRVPGPDQDDERRPVEHASVWKSPPGRAGEHAAVDQAQGVQFERENSHLRGNTKDDLIGDRPRSGEGTDELDLLAVAALPLRLEGRKHPLIHYFSEDAEPVDDHGAGRRAAPWKHGPEGVES